MCYVVIFFIFVLQTIELFAGEDQGFHFTTDGYRDIQQPIDLFNLNFIFAVQNIDPSVATITATQVKTFEGEATPIPLIDCSELDAATSPVMQELFDLE